MNLAALQLEGYALVIDSLRDVNQTTAIAYDAKLHGQSAVIILGGGSPKNFILQTEPQVQDLLGLEHRGYDYFLQITDARTDTGGLSGATPEEAVTWGKISAMQLPDAITCAGPNSGRSFSQIKAVGILASQRLVCRIVEKSGERWRDGVGWVTHVAEWWHRTGLEKWTRVASEEGRGSFLFGLLGLVLVEPAFEEGDGGAEIIVEGDEQVDVVEVLFAAEAVGEVVARIDGGAHFAAMGAEEAEVAFAHFGGRPRAAQRGDGDGHGQVVADAAQQIGGDHGLVPGGSAVGNRSVTMGCQ